MKLIANNRVAYDTDAGEFWVLRVGEPCREPMFERTSVLHRMMTANFTTLDIEQRTQMKPELLIQIKGGRIMHVASTEDLTITVIDHDRPDEVFKWPSFRQHEMLPHDLLARKIKDVRATLAPVPF